MRGSSKSLPKYAYHKSIRLSRCSLGYYVKNGSVTDEVASVKIAIRHIQRKYAALPTQGRFELGWLADFGFLLKRICELD